MSGASAAQRAIRAKLAGEDEPIPLQELHRPQTHDVLQNGDKVPAKPAQRVKQRQAS